MNYLNNIENLVVIKYEKDHYLNKYYIKSFNTEFLLVSDFNQIAYINSKKDRPEISKFNITMIFSKLSISKIIQELNILVKSLNNNKKIDYNNSLFIE